jgi:dihydroflavonol-4-reductase
MTVAVTGASGHIGGNLVRALQEQGRKVRVLVREDRRALEGLDLEEVKGDIFDYDSLLRLTDNVEAVYHCAALISIVGSEGGLVYQTNIEGPENMVRACLENKVPRLVHFSSIHAFESDPVEEIIDETRPLCVEGGSMPYDRSKARGQTLVQNAVKEKGLNAVIVNPGGVVGPFDFKPSRMGSVFLDIYNRTIPALIDGGYNWVDARDVVAGALAAEKKGRAGEAYLLTGHWVHIRDVAEQIGDMYKRKVPTLALPSWLAYMVAYPTLWLGKLTGNAPKFTPSAVEALSMHRHISHEKASRELGYQPRPFQETVRDTIEWFREAGKLRD